LRESIVKAVEVFRRHPDASYEETVEYLRAAVGDADLAERLMEFVPIAFGRVALANSGVKFPDTFRRCLDNGKISRPFSLWSEPLWGPALALAKEEQTQEIAEAGRLAILHRCADFNVYCKACASGVDMRGGVSSDPIFLRRVPASCQPKAWWQFW
jgi:hypothetical protein